MGIVVLRCLQPHNQSAKPTRYIRAVFAATLKRRIGKPSRGAGSALVPCSHQSPHPPHSGRLDEVALGLTHRVPDLPREFAELDSTHEPVNGRAAKCAPILTFESRLAADAGREPWRRLEKL